jgi:Rrp15p
VRDGNYRSVEKGRGERWGGLLRGRGVVKLFNAVAKAQKEEEVAARKGAKPVQVGPM